MSETTITTPSVNPSFEPIPATGNPAETVALVGTDPATEQAEPVQADESTPAESSGSLAAANKALADFGKACRSAADHNYRLASLAHEYVRQFLAASEHAQRSTAVENLAAEWRDWDEESMAESLTASMRRLKARVQLLLRVNAVVTLIGDGSGIAKGDGTAKGRGRRKDGQPLPFGIVRELCPLVERATPDGERDDVWRVVPAVGEGKARELLTEIATGGTKRADVVAAVQRLLGKEPASPAEPGKKGKGKASGAGEGEGEGEGMTQPTLATAVEGEEASPTPASEDAPEDAPPATTDDEAKDETVSDRACRAENLLKTVAEAGAAKDIGAMALEFLAQCEDPDDAMEALWLALRTHNDFSRPVQRAAQAALTALEGERRRHGTNGTVETAPVNRVAELVGATAAA